MAASLLTAKNGDESDSSVGSISLTRSTSQMSLEDSSEVIDRCLDDLDDKKAVVKESALARLTKLLSNRFLKTEVSGKHKQLIDVLCREAKKDQKLALKGIAELSNF